jgi:hypothetical protein
MDTFTDLVIYLFTTALVWHVGLIFFAPDSRYQKYRFRKALDRVHEYGIKNATNEVAPVDLNLIYKNKKFSISLLKEVVNSRYSIYRVYINGEEAGRYHQLQHACLSSYYYEEVNKRHRDEVESIVYAARKVLRDKERPKKIKNNGYTEYSFFN